MMRGVMGWDFLGYSYADFSSEKRQTQKPHNQSTLKFLHHATLNGQNYWDTSTGTVMAFAF